MGAESEPNCARLSASFKVTLPLWALWEKSEHWFIPGQKRAVRCGRIYTCPDFEGILMRMAPHKVAAGQVWLAQSSGQTYLVTRTYAQLFDDYAVLRQVGGEDTVRIKLQPAHAEGPMPGFVLQSAGALD